MKTTSFILVFSLLASLLYSNEGCRAWKEYSIEQFLNTKNYVGGSFAHHENSVLYSSDESGVFNVYSIDSKGMQQAKLTHSQNLAYIILSCFPNDERFLFTADELGNERYHIYLREINGSIKDLTPGEDARSEFQGWSQDQKSFFFTSNLRDPKFMDLYEMDIDSFTPKLIYKNEVGLDFDCISRDKRYVALHRTLSQNNSEIYLYDLTTQKIQHLTPHQGEARFLATGFSAESNALYFLTDENSKFAYLKKLEVPSGKSEIVEKYDWDITDCTISHSGRYRITTINQDGKNVIKIYDQQTQQHVKLPNMPQGDICSVNISKSEQRMLFSIEGCHSPRNLYLYDFNTGATQQLTRSLPAEINPEDLVQGEIIRFASYDGMAIPCFMYKPQGIKPGEKIPALIWVHGGPGGQSRANYNYLIQYLVNHGYAVLAINNRGSSGYGKMFYQAADLKHGDADLDDCIWAKKYLISTGYIDENKIGIIGGSYGGYMTLAALAFRPNEMAVGVDIFGVSNWVRTLKSIPSWWESEKEHLYQKVGNPEKQEEYLKSISPLFHAKNIVKPLLVLQGANDPRVLKVESDQIIESIKTTGIPHGYVVFDDEGHGFAKKQNKMIAATAILEFLDKHLK